MNNSNTEEYIHPNDGKWVLSTNNEEYDCEFFDTRQEAINYARTNDDYIDCKVMWVAQAKFYKDYIDVDGILESLAEKAFCDNEWGEEHLSNVSTEHAKELQVELQKVYNKWAKKHNYEPTFFTVKNEKEFINGLMTVDEFEEWLSQEMKK